MAIYILCGHQGRSGSRRLYVLIVFMEQRIIQRNLTRIDVGRCGGDGSFFTDVMWLVWAGANKCDGERVGRRRSVTWIKRYDYWS